MPNFAYLIYLMFAKRIIEKKLNLFVQREPVKVESVESVICLLDPSQVSSEEINLSLASMFDDKQPQFQFVYYLKRKRKSNAHYSPQFNRYHLHWDGDLLHPYLSELLDQKFDLMLNYFKKSDLALLALSSSIQAGFRVGFSSVDQRLNDLILASDVFQPKQFAEEFPKYYSKISAHVPN